jgi:hypothetical protein
VSLRIVVLLARHGADAHAGALEELRAFYDRRLPKTSREFLVIDNALPASWREPSEAATLIGAAEGAREFSSWQAGLDALGDRVAGFDFVHLATAAFQALYATYIERFDEHMLEAVKGRAAAVGHIDRYDAPVRLFGRASQSWLRSSFVFLPPTELRLLRSLLSVTDGEALFSGDPARPFRADAPIDAAYQSYITGWLTAEEGTGQGVTWHSRFKLDAETLPLFEAKSLAILNEHALTVRLREQGCAAVDATWLATVAANQHRSRRESGAIPPWRDQLAQRDVDSVRVD